MADMIIGETYKIIFLSNLIHKGKLIKIHTPKTPYDTLYTFEDEHGVKINFIDSLVKSRKFCFSQVYTEHYIVQIDDLYN
jgi:hypothetical protein